MPKAATLDYRSPGLRKGVARAPRGPAGRCHALAQWSDGPAWARAYRRARSDAAVGGEGVTQAQDGRDLEAHLQDVHVRRQAQRDRPQPIRRVDLPPGPGKRRPIGPSAFEDKLGQEAGREVLAAISAQDLCDGS